jgi:cell division protein FtsQ
MKKILHISFIVILIAGTIFLLGFTDQEHQHKNYRNFRIEILNPSDQAMITLDEINELINKNFGDIEGTPITWIDLVQLEKTVLDNPYVSSCEVYQTIECDLVLKARVREPLVRVINQDDQQFYLDYNGFAMPVTPVHPSLVPIANGYISDHFVSLDKTEKPLSIYPQNSALHQVYPVAYYIANDNFLKSFIDQIYVNEKLEIELVPKIGSQKIIFGNAADASEKLENLKTFYLKVMSKMDWRVYKSINLKYKNQVVCTKL